MNASFAVNIDSNGNNTVGKSSTRYHSAVGNPSNQPPSGFVTWNGNSFILNGNSFYPCGPNIYWLGIAEDMTYPPASQIDEMFKVTKMMGATAIRSHTLGFSSGSRNTLLTAQRTYNNEAWGSIDYSYYMARLNGIKLIIPLTDSYAYSHGNNFN